MEWDERTVKLVVAMGASFTLYGLFLITTWKSGKTDQQTISVLVFITMTLLGADLVRGGGAPPPGSGGAA